MKEGCLAFETAFFISRSESFNPKILYPKNPTPVIPRILQILVHDDQIVILLTLLRQQVLVLQKGE